VKRKKQRPKRARVEINVQQLDQIVDKAYEGPLSHEEGELLKSSIHAMAERLMRQPRTTEKAKELPGGSDGDDGSGGNSGAVAPSPPSKKEPRPGHGRNGAADYGGATVIPVSHPELTSKCTCPGCCKGKVYELKPSPLIRIVGMPPIQATVYNLQQFRCNLCGEIYTTAAPPGVGEEKYDASVASMVAQLKYGSGLPFNRIENLEKQMGIPLPAGTQFDLVDAAADKLQPVHDELVRLAAQGTVLHHDDTSVRILDEVPRPEGQDEDRTGLHTTGTVSRVEKHTIALFTSGPQHAGENMADLLERRQKDLPPPVLMADALSHNVPKVAPELEVVLSNCLTHGRRQFVDVFEAFPKECRHVIDQLGKVYWHDAQAREKSLDAQARLAFHQEKSGPVMDGLKKWMESQLEDKLTEPNSGLGKAIRYFLKRWDRLTLFLRHPGAPIDNNVAERALKKAVLNRKNSLFYKTLHGAQVGDLFMSIIHTCELNAVKSFQYMTELQRHAEDVRANPEAWLPWNFHLQLSSDPEIKTG
jgi:hypothetical protein